METSLALTETVGTTLRKYREDRSLRQGDIAKKADISVSMLSQIERGVTSPSLETLSRICSALDISISEVFATVEDREHVTITSQGERPVQSSKGVHHEQICSYHEAMGSGEMSLISLDSGSKITFPSSGEGRDGVQMGYVLSGTATLLVDGKEYTIRSGDGIAFPANRAHSIKNRPPTSFSLARKFIAVWAVAPSRQRTITFDDPR